MSGLFTDWLELPIRKRRKSGTRKWLRDPMTASMRAPMPGKYVEVYTYMTARLMKRQGKELPDFMAEKLERGLTQYEEYTLENIKSDIYRARGGEIDTPLLNVMRSFKKENERKKDDPHLSLF